MGVLLTIVAFIFIVLALVMLFESGGLSLIMAFAVAALWYLPIHEHAKDLSQIKYGSESIDIYKRKIARLKQTLDAIPKTDAALMNNDAPVKSLVEALSEAESDLSWEEKKVVIAKRSVEARAMAFTSYALWFFGD